MNSNKNEITVKIERNAIDGWTRFISLIKLCGKEYSRLLLFLSFAAQIRTKEWTFQTDENHLLLCIGIPWILQDE